MDARPIKILPRPQYPVMVRGPPPGFFPVPVVPMMPPYQPPGRFGHPAGPQIQTLMPFVQQPGRLAQSAGPKQTDPPSFRPTMTVNCPISVDDDETPGSSDSDKEPSNNSTASGSDDQQKLFGRIVSCKDLENALLSRPPEEMARSVSRIDRVYKALHSREERKRLAEQEEALRRKAAASQQALLSSRSTPAAASPAPPPGFERHLLAGVPLIASSPPGLGGAASPLTSVLPATPPPSPLLAPAGGGPPLPASPRSLFLLPTTAPASSSLQGVPSQAADSPSPQHPSQLRGWEMISTPGEVLKHKQAGKDPLQQQVVGEDILKKLTELSLSFPQGSSNHSMPGTPEDSKPLSCEALEKDLKKESKKKKKRPKKKNKDKAKGDEQGRNNEEKSIETSDSILKAGIFNQNVLNEDGELKENKATTSDSLIPAKSSAKKKKTKRSEETFEPYISRQDAIRGIQEKKLIEGEFRINVRNYTEAFVTDPETGFDILILGLLDRNRALDGDIVAVEVKDEEQWLKQKNDITVKTGKVVHVLERVHHGVTVGSLQLQSGVFMLIPRDSRFPLLRVPPTSLPQSVLAEFKADRKDTETLYRGLLLTWNSPRYAYGMIQDVVGKRGDIDVETTAIFAELGLEKNPIPESFNRFLPSLPYVITEEEIASRLDLRSEVIFTIDPATARDLDDAVSIKRLSDGTFEVGVHISDVTHFLKEGTPLDIEVSGRATTVYMVERAYHMLPIALCGLCSLLPGEDKLAVSVIFKMDQEGNVLDLGFTRSVINSCAQLSYDHAQAFLDGEDVALPKIYNDVPVSVIREAVLELNKIAVARRKRRFENGALRIDQPKVSFDINPQCVPQSMYIYELKDSNRLIEEFMLLANEAVARYIHSNYPEVALLRRHDPPKEEMMNKLATSLKKLGIFLDLSSAGSLHQSLTKYIDGDIMRATVLHQLCAKPMNRAVYFCCSSDTHHFALNVDKYTHFTSPIRRYADIVVHRILTACLGYTQLPPWTRDDVDKFASTSNRKKYAAKKAGEMSSNFFRTLYIKSVGQIITQAVITGVNSRSVDTIVPSMALNIRVYIENSEYEFNEHGIVSSLILKWPGTETPQILQVFTSIQILLRYSEKLNNLEAKLLPPEVEGSQRPLEQPSAQVATTGRPEALQMKKSESFSGSGRQAESSHLPLTPESPMTTAAFDIKPPQVIDKGAVIP